MSRLYDRILANRPHFLTARPGADCADEARRLNALLPTLPAVVVDNVVKFVSGLHEDEGWVPERDFPNVAPPLERFWIEAQRPHSMRWAAETDNNVGTRTWGAIVESLPVDNHLGAFAGDAEVMDVEIRWIISLSVYVETKVPHTVIGPMFCVQAAVKADGMIAAVVVAPLFVPAIADWSLSDEAAALYYCVPFFAAICFMHCKNVERREVRSSFMERDAWKRKHRRPLVRYHVLDIDPMRKVLRTEGRSDEVGLKKALHICRGHFATYTEDAPLFGRVTGTFWKPQHVRGSIDGGAVVKDYRVKAPR